MKSSRLMVARAAAVGAFVAVVSPQVLAASTSSPIDVTLKIPQACTISNVVNVDFGTPTLSLDSATEITTNGSFDLKCRKQAGNTVTVTIEKGSPAVGVTGGTMKDQDGVGTNEQAYTLHSPTGTTWAGTGQNSCNFSAAWPAAGLDLGEISATGTKTIAVCAKASVSPDTPVGDYKDTLQIVVNF